MEKDKTMGWEISRRVEQEKPSIIERLKPDKKAVRAFLIGIGAFFAVFFVSLWLAGNPFEATQRIASDVVTERGWVDTNEWTIFWWVVGLAILFEFLDASAGMGYGTAITPLLLMLGFDPKQIVPAVMIQQATAGLVGAYLHREFENVEWKFKPMSETVKLWLIISVTGSLAVIFSITAVYAVFKVAKVWIALYVAILLVMMGFVSLFQARKERPYRPKWMIGFATLAGFNKGIGGGGYGPVVTIGGLISGIPVKSMMGVTAISEGTTCVVSIIVWLAMLASGEVIDYILLPSMMLGSMVAAVAAPYMTRVLPEKIWRWLVPAYSCILAFYVFYKTMPDVLSKISG